MLMRKLKRWLAPFIRECFLADGHVRNWALVFTCLSCSRSISIHAQFCACCGKQLLPMNVHYTARVQDTDPIEMANTKPLIPILMPQVEYFPPAAIKLRPFLGYVRRYRGASGPSGPATIAHREAQETEHMFW